MLSSEQKINIPIYWINLNRSTDRKTNFIKQLETYKITNETRIEGIDGNDINFESYKNNTIKNLTRYELCCTLSHLKAIKCAKENGDKMALIMEDDCNFDYVKYQNKTINEISENLNVADPNWGILQLTMCNRSDHNIRISNATEHIEKGYRNCTTCYLINEHGMSDLLNNSNKSNTIYSQADYYLYKLTTTYYLTKPYFIYNYSSACASNVHNMGINSKQTLYKREDDNKKFWDIYYSKNEINF